jgi:hypothetical protein
MFRDQVGQQQWIASLKQFRQPLGSIVTRSVGRVDFTKTLRGARRVPMTASFTSKQISLTRPL